MRARCCVNSAHILCCVLLKENITGTDRLTALSRQSSACVDFLCLWAYHTCVYWYVCVCKFLWCVRVRVYKCAYV
jgi:hypothetical protein